MKPDFHTTDWDERLYAALSPARAMKGADISARVMERVTALPAYAGKPFAGWWKVPALALASCAVYALCVEGGLFADTAASLAAAINSEREASNVSAMVFGRGGAGKGELLAMVLERGNK